jgi:hypothetical protein
VISRALAVLVALPLLAATPAAGEEREQAPALHLEAGSVARHQIVAVGRDVTVEGSALSGVTALDGDALIAGEVAGDVVVVGGDVELAPSAVVRGDVYVVGGELHAGAGARLEGRSVAYPSVSRAWMTLLEGPSLGLSALSPRVLAAKLALAAAWLAVTLLLFAVGGGGVTRTSEEVRLEPWACFVAGLVTVLAATVSALVLSALLPPLVAVPLLALVVLAATLAKLWGMVALFHALGHAIEGARGPGARRRRWNPLHAAVAGLALLAAVKLVPYLGLWAWTAGSLVGIGAALRTKFGRREAWFADAISAPPPVASR